MNAGGRRFADPTPLAPRSVVAAGTETDEEDRALYPAERQEAIATFVATHGRAAVTDLADRFEVTQETVRRDLDRLEEQGLVRRVHGGAVPAGALGMLERGVASRDVERADEKDAIARAALPLLPPSGSAMLLDAGTTTGRLARVLPPDLDLTVVTNGVPLAARLAGWPGVRLRMLGGRVRGRTLATVGDEAIAALQRLRVDVAFLGTNGLSAAGATTPHEDEAAAKRAMAAAARRVVVLADSSKFGLEMLNVFASLDDIDVVVTDDALAEEHEAWMAKAGVEVVLA